MPHSIPNPLPTAATSAVWPSRPGAPPSSAPTNIADATQGRELAARLKVEGLRLGFDLVGIAPAVVPGGVDHLAAWLDAGYAGEMHYLPRRRDAYSDPGAVLPEVRSLVIGAINYHTQEPPPLPAGAGRVSRYAWTDTDYHAVLRDRLKNLGDVLHQARPGCRTRAIVDSAPVLERDFARMAGLGWFGKNTMLLNKRLGSWFFLGAVLTDVALPPDEPHHSAHCGTCTRCLDACPTQAFVEPYVLDARRCISYLTIELRDRPIPGELREGLGDWVFGCDVCQDVCPWNRKAPVSADPAFAPQQERQSLSLARLLEMTDAEFDAMFSQTALARPGREALLRNACVAAANSGGAAELEVLGRAEQHSSPLVREAARWGRHRVAQRLAELSKPVDHSDGSDLAGRMP